MASAPPTGLQVDEALTFYSEARELAVKHLGANSVSATMVTGFTAFLLYERGDVSTAEISVLDRIEIIETSAYHDSFLSAYTVLVRAAVFRGDLERAMMLLDRAEKLARDHGWGRVVAAFMLERIRLLLREQRRHDVSALVDELQEVRDLHPAPQRCSWSDIHVAAAVAEGLLLVDAGRTGEALPILTWAYDDLLATKNMHGALRVGLELSNAHFLTGAEGRPKALDLLSQILAWAAKAGMVSFLLERWTQFDRLLSAARRTNRRSPPNYGSSCNIVLPRLTCKERPAAAWGLEAALEKL